MTPFEIEDLAIIYAGELEEMGVVDAHDFTARPLFKRERLGQALDMCYKIPEFINQGRVDSALAFLGFVQGILWVERMYTLKQIQEDNTFWKTFVTSIPARTITWIGGDGNWSDPDMWSTGEVPSLDDDVLLTGPAAFGSTNTWVGGSDGAWNNPSSWSAGVVPTWGDVVRQYPDNHFRWEGEDGG